MIVGASHHVRQVPQVAFEEAAKSIRKQITPDMMKKYQAWSEKYGLKSA
jgi:AAA family ATPase